jgi:predicted nucleic acid-binding protein
MEVKRWKIFLDTSALIAGVVSSTGAAREVLRLAEVGLIELVISRQVLTEADRNISTKLSSAIPDYERLLKALKPSVVEDPSPETVKEARLVIHHNDAPILAAAREAHVDYLVSWNTMHFQTCSVRDSVDFPVVTPGELLIAFRRMLLSQL